MYWGIGTLIIGTMIAVLAVAASQPLPQSLPLLQTSPSLFLPCMLIVITIFLILFKLRISLPVSAAVSRSAKPASLITTLRFLKPLRYLIIALLVLGLLAGSLLQALVFHQQLERTKITASTRVQAWVTIEGLSDSVYDATMNSGYRQVATLSEIVPLSAELSADELAAQSNNTNSTAPRNNLSKPRRVLLSLYPNKANDHPSVASLNSLQPGQRVLMSLALAPLVSSEQALNNSTGFDSYRWLRARHIDGVATIIALSSATEHLSLVTDDRTSFWRRVRITIDQWRLSLRQHFYQDWANKTAARQQAEAVTLSLLTGDRSLINRETKDLYQLAGISHLLAISGTHVLFMAIMLAALAVRLLQRFYPALYRLLPRWQVRWGVMIGSAFIYALFTGFDVPAARTAWMLLALGLVRLTLVPISTLRVLLALAVLMAWMDPYVLWQAGYWLSFIAVALLLNYEQALADQSSVATMSQTSSSAMAATLDNNNQGFIKLAGMQHKGWSLFKRLFRLQFWLFIALLPITLLLFGKVSLWGLVINLFAIGLFGWVIVPLNLLAGLSYLLSPAIADSIWGLVSTIVAQLHQLIEWLTTLPMLSSAWLYTPINFAMLLMAALIILPWLLPRGLVSRLLSLVPLTLLVMSVYANQQAFSETPTLYILPTGDRYLTAALLIYSTDKKNSSQDKVSWLFLADHRVQGAGSRPSSLSADKLAKILEQQLRTLALNNLDGIVVQSSDPALSARLSDASNRDKRKVGAQNNKGLQDLHKLQSLQPLLALTVARLSQALPTAHYWQAGRHERWQALQSAKMTTSENSIISAQDCEQGKQWQDLSGQLKVQALSGWREIDDAGVWDCSVAIDSPLPITVVHYNASNPQQPTQAAVQTLIHNKKLPVLDAGHTDATMPPKNVSRLILDSATHKRSWQLWLLLCRADPLTLDMSQVAFSSTTWLSHSSSAVSAEVLMMQSAEQILTYDEQPLEAALMIEDDK